MNKNEKIQYLNTIKQYLNLSAVCNLYNESNKNNIIDYNNLRVVLNGQSRTRLSEDKIDSFIEFIYSDFLAKLLPNQEIKNSIKYDRIQEILELFSINLCERIKKELEK